MPSNIKPKYLNCGDRALSVQFGDSISPSVNAYVKGLCDLLSRKPVKGVTEFTPSYRAVLVSYDPLLLSHDALIKKINKLIPLILSSGGSEKKIFEIPVCYDGEFSPDMENVVNHSGLSREEIIKIHSGTDYLIYMIGFLPGFPYLGGLDERISTPRLKEPRTRIPSGSVGIGGAQTGVYPVDSPGGWQLIGRTPVKLYDPERAEPIVYSAGDYIRFKPVSIEEYYSIKEQCDNGEYDFHIMKG